MGCDIHMWAEIKKKPNNPEAKPEWRTVAREFKSKYYREDETATYITYGEGKEFGSYEDNEILTDHPYEGRNYNVFAILANVRNGRGFAGVDTGDGFVPIAEPRGIPEDASDYYKHQVEAYGENGHSHSYLTLQELLDYDWHGQSTVHRGWVNLENYRIYKETGKPKEWFGEVRGGLVKHVANEDMELPGVDEYTYTQVEWRETYAESAKDFLEALEKLKEISKRKDVLDVRIVFFFDN